MRPKILILGKNGQVGWELQRSMALCGDVVALGREQANLLDTQSLLVWIQQNRPNLIVNAAAYTAVDKAEVEESIAHQINALAVGEIATAAQEVGALFIHYSTDYVFDGGATTPYLETDAPCPLNAYGRSKLAGELAIQAVDGDYLILRTTWVYATRGQNFMKTMLRLAKERDSLRIVGDQIGAPTWARFIAEATADMAVKALSKRDQSKFLSGIYNLSAAGETSWHGFASLIIDYAKKHDNLIKTTEVSPIDTCEYPLPAKRPLNSRLSGDKLNRDYGIILPAWDVAAELCLADILH
ncbi:MAG: dTDP-4-dehydrorhamnose reductase [Gallionella sp.]|nr:dTDP-4-dehydrorhamnose reductase [Gallionella sp.]